MNILITGISRGLGKEIANQYAAEGHAVFGISRSSPKGLDSQVNWQSGDVTCATCSLVVDDLLSQVSHLDILINNAGCGSSGSQLESVDPAELTIQLALHCVGPLKITKAAIAKLRKADSPKIINITSRLGSISRHQRGDFAGRKFSYCYRVAKCAQNMLTVCMQGDKSLEGVIIAALNPGLLRTESGSRDARHTAREGAIAFIHKVAEIKENGSYHAFDEDATL
jgi:NAD(P)-dependent dehydrogenase (short-subunit alcohol dehydrogenase family)